MFLRQKERCLLSKNFFDRLEEALRQEEWFQDLVWVLLGH